MTSTCPACGQPVDESDWRCTNLLDDGSECGKLLDHSDDGAEDRRAGRAH